LFRKTALYISCLRQILLSRTKILPGLQHLLDAFLASFPALKIASDIAWASDLLRGMAISYSGLKEESKIFPRSAKMANKGKPLFFL
jgi:hypothetical protein